MNSKKKSTINLLRFFTILISIAFLIVILVSNSFAAEDWKRFVKGLEEKEQFDTIIDYLKTSYEKSDCPQSLKDEYYFRLGKARFALLSKLKDQELKKGIETCKNTFTKFLSEKPGHDLELETNFDLARLSVYEAKIIIHESQKMGSETEKQSYRQQARPIFEKAEQYLKRTLDLGAARIKQIQEKSPNKQNQDLSLTQGIFLSAKIMLANLPADRAETWPKNSEEAKKDLEEARKKLEEIGDKYQQYTGVYSAKYQLAQVLIRLDKTKDAEKILTDLSVLPMEPAYYQIKTDILKLRFELWKKNSSNEKAEQQVGIILQLLADFDDWKNKTPLPDSFYQSVNGQQIHLDAGRAVLKIMQFRSEDAPGLQKILKESNPSDSKTIKAVRMSSQTSDAARQLLTFVSDLAGPLSLEAEDLLSSPLLETESRKATAKKQENGSDLLTNAKKGWLAYIRAYQNNQKEGTPASREELERVQADSEEKIRTFLEKNNESPNSNSDVNTGKTSGKQNEKTGGKNTSSASAEDLNSLRLNLATICFMSEKYIEVVKIADKLCRLNDFKDAPKAAEITLYALKKLYGQYNNPSDEKEKKIFAAVEKKTADLISFIVSRWGGEENGPGASIAREAILLQIETAIENGRFDQAKKLLSDIPETSSQRINADLRYGQALWSEYVRKINSENEQEKQKDKLDTLLEDARKSLTNGLTRLVSNSAARSDDYLATYSALSLAQISLTVNDSENALKWLTHPVIGPFHLVEFKISQEKNGANKSDGDENLTVSPIEDKSFQMTTMLLMLRIYISSGKLTEAEKIIDLVEKLGGNGNAEKLAAIYVQLGLQLEKQLRQVNNEAIAGNADRQKDLQDLTKGFEKLLDRISQKENGSTYASLRWVAGTYMSMARGMAGSLTDSSKKAVDYYTRAGRIWQSMLKKTKTDPSWSTDPKSDLFLSVRLAECLRETGRYDKALMILQPVVAANQNHLELQEEAAKIYQEWGRHDKEYFLNAILGGFPDKNGKNQIWGWNMIINRLNRVVEKDPRFRESFYNAWLNKFFCRYQYLRRLTDDAQRRKQAADAEREMLRLKQVHPDLGGPVFKQKFDDHLRRIRKEQKEADDIK